jgi:hypothetical protein
MLIADFVGDCLFAELFDGIVSSEILVGAGRCLDSYRPLHWHAA